MRYVLVQLESHIIFVQKSMYVRSMIVDYQYSFNEEYIRYDTYT